MNGFHGAAPDKNEVTGYKFTYDEEKFSKSESITVWFALFTCNAEIDSDESLQFYRMKDSGKKTFDALKHDLGCKRLTTHKSETTDCILFVITQIMQELVKCS